MEPRVSLMLSFILSSLLLPFLSQATSSGPSRVGPFGHLESFGSFNHLEGSKKGDKREGIQKVKQYLQRYGYLSSTHYSQMGSDDFDDALESSLKAFQTFYHLNSTGTLDAPTATLMSKPRCGFPDHPPNSNSTINPNYAYILSVKWPPDQMHIHYVVFPGSQPEQPITNGFNAWAAVSKFTFERVREESRAVLRVTFGHRDGPGGTLGSAAPSYTDATIILDEDDSWTVGAVPGSHDLETVVTHEIGHILGLAHSQYKEALMYALIDDGVIKKLAQDDIDGIRVRYS
ncbi:hypothetical protein VitviT2T_003015 [Vitis vinifera]|uniref:Peptidase metallopeptidase domain-containing protein n=2 Tax=Vitis vinifera TaxID=29760 RepID=A0ABY9BKI1_VITVI|nr:metalloendoproteinase 1-like [Vitis vinifera]RVW36531.1 Metalloendoproteinase 5-MMP [Vitis vinifera]WJZ83324.1 hypothetical protein VitviT2T_003015 [Vitis vinifera]|eukprot:XP_010647717.1 PREDICTED: metalloendoproteinase 1-like [Vitis vinifera]